ncbi:MAG: hypothetical protein H7145_06405 [Akkermansiaceae bacterium]|nr:hypothetical protein [Armatimonadota bacterium]
MLLRDVECARLLVLTIAGSSACCSPVLAQNPPRKSGEVTKHSGDMRPMLDLLRYDPKRQGPLLCVLQKGVLLEYDDGGEKHAKQTAERKTPAQFAEAVGLRALVVGDITAIVPRTMKEIVKNPGKPDPYAGMQFAQRFTLLLAALTKDQWKQVGSENGIGLSDLTREQRSLFAGIWRSDALKLQKIRIPAEAGEVLDVGEPDLIPVSEVRFRLSRRLTVRLQSVAGGSAGSYQPYPKKNRPAKEREREADGSTISQVVRMTTDSRDADEPGSVSAFGVPIIVTSPNRLKPGHLALDAPAVNRPMRLDGSRKTVGELLESVGDVTRLRLVTDKRIASLPVGCRVAPGGQVVSTGDVLKALCRSLTGTFRRLDGPNGAVIYLLTDDVEGIGTRFARLERWAQEPSQQRNRINQKALDDCGEADPLSALGFLPSNDFGLPEEQLKKMDDSYRGGGWGNDPTFPVSELTPELREDFMRSASAFNRGDRQPIRTDVVGLESQLQHDWILPNGRAYPAQFNEFVNYGLLRSIAAPSSHRAKPRDTLTYKNPAPTVLPPALKRRVLVAQLPETASQTRSLFALLRRKGFTEAWLSVANSDAATLARFREAVTLGGETKTRVGVVIPWLLKEDAGAGSVPEINILGENGTAVYEEVIRSVAGREGVETLRHHYANRYMGWVVPGSQNIPSVVRRVAPFLRLAGLSAVVFTNSAAPGYTGYRGDSAFGDGYNIGDRFGYSAQTRFRCVIENGFDPVDAVSGYYLLGVSADLPFFPQRDLPKPLAEFRRAQNRAHLARIYEAIRVEFPNSPLHLLDSGHEMFDFYARWEKPSGALEPEKGYVWEAKQLRGMASRFPFPPVIGLQGIRPEHGSAYFWNTWHDTAEETAKSWGGLALNLPTDHLADVIALLEKFPDDTPPPQ